MRHIGIICLLLVGCAHIPPHTITSTHHLIEQVPSPTPVDNPYSEEGDGVLDNPYDTTPPKKIHTPESVIHGHDQPADNPYEDKVCKCLYGDPLCSCL